MSDAIGIIKNRINRINWKYSSVCSCNECDEFGKALKEIVEKYPKALLALDSIESLKARVASLSEQKEELKVAKQCIDYQNIKCDNKGCLNKVCPLNNNKNKGVLSLKSKIEYHKNYLDRNFNVKERNEMAYEFLKELIKELEEGVL